LLLLASKGERLGFLFDYSPTEFINPSNAGVYTTENLARMAEQLKPNGVFASVDSHLLPLDNPFQSGQSTNSVYVCVKE
jgi:hypothetical protein